MHLQGQENIPAPGKMHDYNDIVYKATVTTSNTNSTKYYIDMTASTFKERYRNHIKSFNHKRYPNDTEFSKYIWKLKDNKQDFDITWSVLKQSISYIHERMKKM